MNKHTFEKVLLLVPALVVLTMAVASTATAADATAPVFEETEAEHDARMKWFREARFGMFIHWGLYSELAGEWEGKKTGFGAEWIQERFAIPGSQYSELAKDWNPKAYNARKWVRQMKAAGIRYICITSKHHDGFCLWPTKANDDWNIIITPYKKDLLKPLAEACRKEGVKFSLYHSVMDWHHPDWTGQSFNDLRQGKPDLEKFKHEYLFPQLKELFSNYGDIGMLWLDGTWDKAWTSEDGKEMEAYIRKLQPSVVLNNRSGYKPKQRKFNFKIKNAYSYITAGDYISPEAEIPPTGLPGIDWETCQTMQPPKNWGYNRNARFRTFPDLLRELVDVSSKGGNLLLNVGPNADGELLPEATDRLKQFAGWMKNNSESIHGTTASPFEQLLFNGRCTQKPGRLYMHVFDWPKDGKLLVPMKNRVKRAYLLADPRKKSLSTQQSKRGVIVSLPKNSPDAIDSVVVVEIVGEVEVVPPLENLAVGKPVEVSSVWEGRSDLLKTHITDGNPTSIWATEERARSGWVQIDLQQPRTVMGVTLREGSYDRIQAFDIEAKVSGAWKKVASGTTIGRSLLLTTEPVKAQLFRLNIRKASDTPTLADFQLHGVSK